MAELVPVPLPLLLRRAFLEYRREGKIFDLPREKFFRGIPGMDFSVVSNGHRASTPLGPAAGPHGQLAQNIVLAWLAGARIIELKTVQILDELKIPRPCIDAANVGYNVEWSQELRLEQSLTEYVSAVMCIEILKASGLLGEEFAAAGTDTVFDMSVGYSLEGIRSPRMRRWIESMKSAEEVVDRLCASLTGTWARYRNLPFPICVSDSVTLSTFHGCPAGEIEGIVTFLLAEMNVDVCIKLNPTLLGKPAVEHLLHDVMGYHDIAVTEDVFSRDLQFDEALDLLPRLDRVARANGKRLSVKFSNTLVVRNHRKYFSGDVMYMSGAPLHVLTLNLVKQFRERMGATLPVSFSAGLDAHNMPAMVAMNFVPVTTCTDLLRPGGYARLPRYLANLAEQMRAAGVSRIPDYVVRAGGHAAEAVEQVARGRPEAAAALRRWLAAPGERLNDVCLPFPGVEDALVNAAGLLNTPTFVERATADPRYRWEHNHAEPRKIGSKLWLYDCINCDKCVPVCPNDANFVYEATAPAVAYDNFEITEGEIRRVPGGQLPALKTHQIANYADACNECGNCDIFCPEDGGPYIQKPRFFGSLESYRRHGAPHGFYIYSACGASTIYGTIGGRGYTLRVNPARDRAWFRSGPGELEISLGESEPVAWRGPGGHYLIDMRPYWRLKLLLESVGDPRRVHFANVAGLEEEAIDH